MENLAGDSSCDSVIRKELSEAKIPMRDVGPSRREVPYTVEGRLGPIKFWRAWYYWIVEGYIPLNIAAEIYANPIGRRDVRTDGYAGNYDPEKWVIHIRKEYDKYAPYIESGGLPPDIGHVFGKDPEKARQSFLETMEKLKRESEFITCYHIDSQEGLNFFVEIVKKYGLDKSDITSSEGGYIGAFGQKYGSLQDGAPKSQRKNEGTW